MKPGTEDGRLGPRRCLLVATLLSTGCRSSPVDVKQLPDPHCHFGNVHLAECSTNVTGGVAFRPAPALLMPTSILLAARSPDGRTVAYTGPSPTAGLRYEPEMLFLTDPATGRDYRLENPYFPHRWIADLQWIDCRCFCFDIWTGPHFGVHYVIDAKSRTLLHAVHFHDDFIEDLDRQRRLRDAQNRR